MTKQKIAKKRETRKIRAREKQKKKLQTFRLKPPLNRSQCKIIIIKKDADISPKDNIKTKPTKKTPLKLK